MTDVDNLRQEVRKRRAAVTAKERRILNNTGIDLRGTSEDPRRAPSVIKGYNSRQLSSYLSALNRFMARSNGYVADNSGGFIHKSEWLGYKRLERKYNAIVKSHFESIGDILDPYRNVTIREAEPLYVPDSKRAQGDVVHRPYSIVDRNNKNIKNAASLEKLKKSLEGKLDKGYLPKAIKAGRDQANSMMDNAGLSDLKEVVNKLSDHQFNVLWNYWGFASRLGQIGSSGSYRGKNVREQDKGNPLSAQDQNDIRDDVRKIIVQAQAIKDNAAFRKKEAGIRQVRNNGQQVQAIKDNNQFRKGK